MTLQDLTYDEGSLSCLSRKGRKLDGSNHGGYRRILVGGKPRMAHIVVLEIHYGKVPAGFLIDHIDRNKSNNRIGNLRLVTHSQNQQNRGKDSRKASGLPKGVSRHSKGGYQARIKLDGISYEKYHKSLEEAVKWRSLKEIELHTHRPL